MSFLEPLTLLTKENKILKVKDVRQYLLNQNLELAVSFMYLMNHIYIKFKINRILDSCIFIIVISILDL